MIHFTNFIKPTNGISLPKKFTFPFYYDPHILAELASEELQDYLKNQTELKHSLGFDKSTHEIGKMFGVLVVENNEGKIGYLSAYSGNIANQPLLKRFVPPIYDKLSKDSFFYKDNIDLLSITNRIDALANNQAFLLLQKNVNSNNDIANKIISIEKNKLKKRRQERRILKKRTTVITDEFKVKQNQESINDRFYLKELINYYENKFSKQQTELTAFTNELTTLKELRINKSNTLHEKIFEQYSFLNYNGIKKSLNDIFADLKLQAPGGTGDCAAPKLLQYAYLNNLKPIALAEFWYGKSGNSKIRKHKNYYPSCKGKCEPVLTHMLAGLEMDENPLIKNLAEDKEIAIIYEDSQILAINKPIELLSVNGKTIKDSVFSRLKKLYPLSEKYLIVHRLDMSTSGIMLIAKTKKANKFLQNQFINKTIQKQYIAILDGIINENEGEINLPLRVDLEDRPKQLVCYEHGKNAKTKWKVLERKNKTTKILFTPITGRTHQLRVHSAHHLGLNTAIIGDDLYGKKANRLHLHAAYIKFVNPLTKKIMELSLDVDFEIAT